MSLRRKSIQEVNENGEKREERRIKEENSVRHKMASFYFLKIVGGGGARNTQARSAKKLLELNLELQVNSKTGET